MDNETPHRREGAHTKHPLLRIYLLTGFVAAIAVGSLTYVFYVGNRLDRQYDYIFREFGAQADLADTQLQQQVETELAMFKAVQMLLLAICLSVTAVVGLAFRSFVRRRMKNEIELRAANKQLMASEQQFRAANQQLTANEQQLRAANQQLTANEQLLQAANQQLRANEQRLQAANQQLWANEQQLQAANQQLRANEQRLQAANQQLRADEQRLQAANQQLWANEQQLQAANQQLRANEQQLHAANQQLTANEQQLRAANQQLIAGEQQLRASEQELRRERNRFRKYLDVAAVMLVVIDREQHVDLINKKGCELLGYDEGEILGKNWFECFVPERLRGQVRAAFEELTAGQIEPVEYYENEVLTKDGREKLISWHNAVLRNEEGEIVATLSSGEDITERRQAEEALHESQSRLQQIADTVEDVFWMTDWTTHKTIFASRAYERVWGRSRESLYADAEGWADAIHPEDRQRAWDTFVNLGKGQGYSEEYRVVHPDGSIRWVLNRGTPFCNEQGEVVRVVGIAQDITARKNRESELAEYRNKLRSLVSELTIAEDRERKNIASLLHDDVLQKLALSKMRLSMLRETLTSSDQIELLDGIHDCVSEMFTDMRSLTFDLCPPILYDIGLEAAVRDWLQKEMADKHGIAVNLETAGQPLRLREDVRVALYRAIREVLINVIKHANAQKVNIALANLNDTVRIEIQDDGMGFDRARAEAGGGSPGGMGLFTVRERLEYFGGSLETESSPCKGSRVILTAALTGKEAHNKE